MSDPRRNRLRPNFAAETSEAALRHSPSVSGAAKQRRIILRDGLAAAEHFLPIPIPRQHREAD